MVPAQETAKLVLQDGELHEFARPVKATHVLQTMHPAFFVCDADDMVFDSQAPAADELRPGKIYFVLPVSMLRRPLHAEEMAALAMKASVALMGKVMPAAVFENTISASSKVPGAAKRQRSAANGKWRSGKGRDFISHLGLIPE
ncbi:uncharacterized protein LOC122004616 [Zingiber officinale]|nr:uncharacterized protein LOC122004616 [Zingiber officinale]